MAWLGLAWLGLAWLGLAWLGLAWLGLAWLGLAWLGLAWLGLAWLGKMSGRIVIESQRGVGSTLWFEIPLLKAARELNLDTNIGPTCTAALLRLTPKATRVTTSGSTQHGCSFY
ncbi:hypothetical protein P303_08470 [Xylella fastidiosa MUL0034]|nr:hypothetical protein P303_08470 [Xylella fastidiosa MUL0034]